MKTGEVLNDAKLAALAKQLRGKAGKSQADAARELKVSRAAIAQAENNPEKSFFKLRKRLIEMYSPYTVIGPAYWLEHK